MKLWSINPVFWTDVFKIHIFVAFHHALQWAISGLFFLIFVCLIQLTEINVLYKNLRITGFKQLTFEIGSNRSTNLATTTETDFLSCLCALNFLKLKSFKKD